MYCGYFDILKCFADILYCGTACNEAFQKFGKFYIDECLDINKWLLRVFILLYLIIMYTVHIKCYSHLQCQFCYTWLHISAVLLPTYACMPHVYIYTFMSGNIYLYEGMYKHLLTFRTCIWSMPAFSISLLQLLCACYLLNDIEGHIFALFFCCF